MFNIVKWVMSMYMLLVAKMAKNNPSIMITKVNFELLCDVNLLISLICCHVGNNPCFNQIYKKKDVFVCDYVVAIKIC